MANWCINHLTITGPEQNVTAFREMAVGRSPWKMDEEPNPLNFHNLVPVPPEVLEAGYDEAGCRWQYINWGCKRGACETRIGMPSAEQIVYRFDTPWNAPLVWLASAAKRFSTLSFELRFREPQPGTQGIARASGQILEENWVESQQADSHGTIVKHRRLLPTAEEVAASLAAVELALKFPKAA